MALPPVAAFTGQPDLFVAAQVGQRVFYHVPAYNNPELYTLSGNLDGLTINASRGIITGTPQTTGRFYARVTVYGAAPGVPAGQNSNTINYLLALDVR